MLIDRLEEAERFASKGWVRFVWFGIITVVSAAVFVVIEFTHKANASDVDALKDRTTVLEADHRDDHEQLQQMRTTLDGMHALLVNIALATGAKPIAAPTDKPSPKRRSQ